MFDLSRYPSRLCARPPRRSGFSSPASSIFSPTLAHSLSLFLSRKTTGGSSREESYGRNCRAAWVSQTSLSSLRSFLPSGLTGRYHRHRHRRRRCCSLPSSSASPTRFSIRPSSSNRETYLSLDALGTLDDAVHSTWFLRRQRPRNHEARATQRGERESFMLVVTSGATKPPRGGSGRKRVESLRRKARLRESPFPRPRSQCRL